MDSTTTIWSPQINCIMILVPMIGILLCQRSPSHNSKLKVDTFSCTWYKTDCTLVTLSVREDSLFDETENCFWTTLCENLKRNFVMLVEALILLPKMPRHFQRFRPLLNYKARQSYCIVSTVPAAHLALSGARTSADIVMTRFLHPIHTRLASEELVLILRPM